MYTSDSNTLAGHAEAALKRHKEHVEFSVKEIVAKNSPKFDRHDLAAVREASALVADLARRHPLALNTQVIFLLNEVLHDLKRVEHFVEWSQA